MKKKGKQQIGVRLDADMVARLRTEAKLKRVSVSDVVRSVLLGWMGQAR